MPEWYTFFTYLMGLIFLSSLNYFPLDRIRIESKGFEGRGYVIYFELNQSFNLKTETLCLIGTSRMKIHFDLLFKHLCGKIDT